MPFTPTAKNTMLDAIARGTAPTVSITHVSLHTAAPGNTGANEVSGGGYARQAIAYNAAAAGTIDDSTNGATFSVPAGTTVTHVGYWDNDTGPTFLAWDDVTDETFAAAGTYTVTDSDLTIAD